MERNERKQDKDQGQGYSIILWTGMATKDMSIWKKWHGAEKIGVIGVLNLP